MAKGNLANCMPIMLAYEGGWSDHPSDPGGATMKGITIARYREFKPGATKTQLRNITDAEVQHIYDVGYWRPINGDLLPYGVDLATFDYGVNSGPSRAAKELQRVVGVTADGKIGPATLLAVSRGDGKSTIQALCARRLSFMQSLKIWSTFKRGWSTRVVSVEAKGVAMWLKFAGYSASLPAELKAEAAKADAHASAQNKTATGAAAGGGAVGGGEVVASGDPNWMLIVGVAVVVIAVAVPLLIKARHNRERAIAYAEEAVSA